MWIESMNVLLTLKQMHSVHFKLSDIYVHIHLLLHVFCEPYGSWSAYVRSWWSSMIITFDFGWMFPVVVRDHIFGFSVILGHCPSSFPFWVPWFRFVSLLWFTLFTESIMSPGSTRSQLFPILSFSLRSSCLIHIVKFI